MFLIEVTDKKTKNDFLEVARVIYKNDPNWVCPLDVEIEGIFDRNHNKSFENGDAIRWVLKSENGELLGRIAAFYNMAKASREDFPVGGTGFFECINEFQAASMLFDKAADWLSGKGLMAMDSPVNFGENFIHWGLLVDGFTQQGYGMPYNPRYYQRLFEEYGFQNYFEQYSYHADLSVPFPERQVKFARYIADKENLTFEHFSFSNKNKFLNDAVTIYNAVWSDFHEGYTPLKFEDIELMLEDAKPIINEEFIWFVYDNGKPIAMVIVFPDVNQILKKMKGKLTIWGKLSFIYHKKKKTITRARQLLTAVLPEYQKEGVTGALFVTMVDALKRNGIKEMEMSWVGDYNISAMRIYKLMGYPIVSTHITYRKMMDLSIPFARFTNEHSNKMKKQRNH